MTTILCILGALSWQVAHCVPNSGKIVGVLGPMEPEAFGRVLTHEHVLVDFGGADIVSPDRYKRSEVVDLVLPYLMELRSRGFQSFVECTPAWLGRDPRILRTLSEKSGLNILTNTGYYPIRNGKHLPEHAFEESADDLATRWIRESREGIDGTGIRPGFIKIAVSNAPVPEVDRKIIRAAARTHLETGLTIAMHTGSGGESAKRAEAGSTAMDILREEGVSPQALIWVHAQASAKSWNRLVQAASAGAWISFDGAGKAEKAGRFVEWLLKMESTGYLDQVLISHDNGWYRVGEENTESSFKPYTVISDHLVPQLIEAGWTKARIDQLLVGNPRRAFTISVNRLPPN
jgi:phosphotriesterase-related protein